LLTVVQPESSERRDERRTIRQRMPPVRAVLRARQIAIQMQIMRARQMARRGRSDNRR
jgi:hypothetical protein